MFINKLTLFNRIGLSVLESGVETIVMMSNVVNKVGNVLVTSVWNEFDTQLSDSDSALNKFFWKISQNPPIEFSVF